MSTHTVVRISCLLLCLSAFVSSDVTFGVVQLPGWTLPVPVTELNTAYNDKAAFLSFDGLTLYFCRDSDPVVYYQRIFQATRATPSRSFGNVTEISSLSDGMVHVAYPWVSADNLRLYYYHANGARRLKVSTRPGVDHPWPPGADIAELNELGEVANPTLTKDELVIVFSGLELETAREGWDLWTASRPNRQARFSNITHLTNLNTDAWDMHPSLTPDGLTLYFASNRSGHFQIFRAHRDSHDALFGCVEHIAVLDTPAGSSMYPSITPDGSTLYFGRQKDGEYMDVYMSRATRIWHVDAFAGSNHNDGLSKQTALATIQRAIALASDGDMVVLHPGLYRGAIRFLGKAITVQSAGDAAIIEAPGRTAVSFDGSEGPDSVLRNVIIRNSRTGVLCAHSAPTITNVTVSGNTYGVEAYGVVSSEVYNSPTLGRISRTNGIISNSIIWGNTESSVSGADVSYSCMQSAPSPLSSLDGPFLLTHGNFSKDPLFVDPNHGDYHVRSTRGRYWPEHDVWVLDDVTSPCIDAGDPAADCTAERKPNGGRLNVGAHGGTAYAEMSEAALPGDINGDGVFDITDHDMFLDLWEQHINPPTRPIRRR